MADRETRHRAEMLRRRAARLTEEAARSPRADQRRQMIDMARSLFAAADELQPPNFVVAANERFPGILEMPRAIQKRAGLRILKNFANNPALLADPHTEPLVLP